ncbi:conjugal transfer protein TraD [Acinetobacter ursingii]|uniref:conjugal transfer protein TraD n=1 Tax=Acinetobacter ursingii TaxID=108980 RepID=UPI00195ABF80|nr:conjugal transfer protein TraD [Acinetobacter ursingii]VTX88277.1 Conjugal transfer protein TraD [Acinetobacter ursingii]
MRSQPELPDGHLQFLKALTRPTDYQRLLIELYDKTDRTSIEDKKLTALIKTEKAHIRAMKAKQQVNNLLNAEKAQQRKARTKRLIELGALFDIANLGHLDPATLVGMLSNIKIAPDSPKWDIWHQQGVLILQDRKQAKNAKQEQSVHEND